MPSRASERYVLKKYQPSADLHGIIDEFFEFKFRKLEAPKANPYYFPNYSTALIYCADIVSGVRGIYFAGPCVKKVYLPSSSECYYWAADFQPFTAQFIFGFEVSLLLNKVVDGREVMNERDYNLILHKLNSASTCRNKIKFFENFARDRKDRIEKPDAEINDVFGLIVKSDGKVKLEKIYAGISSSTRKFQRKFLEITGLTPKEFCRIVRIRSAANKIAEDNREQMDVMFEAGYYDQSHYYREFKKLSGVTPTAFKKRYKRITRHD